jgi:hypothetical protein
VAELLAQSIDPNGDFYAPDFYEPDFYIMGTVEEETRRPTESTVFTGDRNPRLVAIKTSKVRNKALFMKGGYVPAITRRELETQLGQIDASLIDGT